MIVSLFLTFAKIGLFTFSGGYAMISIIENTCVEKKKWIKVYDAEAGSRGKKQYLITDAGREVFEAERLRLSELLKNAELIKEK